MKLARIGVAFVVAAIAASSAVADDAAPQKSNKAPARAAHAKSAKPAADQAGGWRDVKFSNPNAPPVGAAPAAMSGFPPAANRAPKEAAGGVSLGLKWHATNEPIDPYDAIRHTSGPDGPGDTFEGGIKLGF